MQTLRHRRGGIIYIRTEDISPNPIQPRKSFDEEALQELSRSIKSYGILNPLTVRLRSGHYELVAGERRLRAAKLAGLKEVPCMLIDVNLEDAGLIALVENLQRRDLDFIEEAQGISRLIRMFGMSQEEAARRIGKSQSAVANKLRLLKLPQNVQKLVTEKKLTMGHVRPLLSLKDEDQMYEAARRVMDRKMSVREVEQYVKELNDAPHRKKAEKPRDPMIVDLETRLSGKLGTKVGLSGKSMTIHFTDTADLNRILEILGCLEEED